MSSGESSALVPLHCYPFVLRHKFSKVTTHSKITSPKSLHIRLLGAVHKRCPHKITKNWLHLCPQNVRTSLPPTPLSVRTHHKFRKIRVFLHQKVRTSASEEPPPPCPKNVRTGQTPSPSDCGRLLWTAPYGNGH